MYVPYISVRGPVSVDPPLIYFSFPQVLDFDAHKIINLQYVSSLEVFSFEFVVRYPVFFLTHSNPRVSVYFFQKVTPSLI